MAHFKMEINKQELVQRKATRIMKGLKILPSSFTFSFIQQMYVKHLVFFRYYSRLLSGGEKKFMSN